MLITPPGSSSKVEKIRAPSWKDLAVMPIALVLIPFAVLAQIVCLIALFVIAVFDKFDK